MNESDSPRPRLNVPAKIVDTEIVPSSIEAIERAQVDVQISTAHRFPRSIEKFRDRALSMATIDQETAESCLYRRPVGKKKGSNAVEYAEGASIRLAEIVAASYGNLRVAARIIEQTERFVKCEGVAHDLESNYAGKSEAFEPTVKSDGTPYSESMRAVVAKACLAKAYRDAVFKVVPRALCKQVYEKAKVVAAGNEKSLDERRAKAKSWLNSIRVDDARVFVALGVSEWSQIGNEQLLTLTGLKTAISDQDTTVEAAFPQITRAPEFRGPESTGVATAPVSPTPPAMPQGQAGGVPTQSEPETLPDQNPEPEPIIQEAVSVPEPVPETEPDTAKIAGKTSTSEALKNVLFLMQRDGVTESQVMAYCKGEGKMAKAQKKLSELADSKLIILGRAWFNLLPKIKDIRT